MLREIFVRLWKDESGAVIATEYLLLGSVVAIGSTSGLVAMRDSVSAEFGEFGNAVRDTRQAYSVPTTRGGAARAGGSAAANAPATVGTTFSPAPIAGNVQTTFGCP